MTSQKFWIGTVSKEHVERGKQGGFIQVCHGKEGPLKRMRGNDIFIYYSPNIKYGEKIPYQCFSAIGVINDKPAYQFEMTSDFIPFRRYVTYVDTKDTPIKPLIPKLQFIQNKNKWGSPFRFGILQVNRDDFICIAKAMGLKNEKINELLETSR